MTVKLPEIEEMRNALLKQAGLTSAQIDAETDKLAKRKPLYRKRRKLMYKHLCDKYKVDLKINYGISGMSHGEYIFVKELTSEKKSVNLRGYILNISEAFPTKTGTLMCIVTFADESGTTSMAVFQKQDGGIIDMLNETFQTFPAPVYLESIQTSEYEGKKSVNIPPFAKWELINENDYDLPPIEKIYENLPNAETELIENQFYVFHGLITDIAEGVSYIGCNKCFKKMDVEKGVRSTCENCNDIVTAVEYTGVNIMLSDEKGELGIQFSSFSNVNMDYLLKLQANDLHPEVLVGAKSTAKYGLSGIWVTPVNDIQFGEDSTELSRGSLDTLDFTNDIPKLRQPITDDVKLAELVELYASRLGVFGAFTVDDAAEYLKKITKSDRQYMMRPIIQKLYDDGLIRIIYDKIELIK